MQRQEIISNLYEDRNFNHVIQMMHPAHLRSELKSEVMYHICELPEEKIKDLHNRGVMVNYAVKMICNVIKRGYNGFNKTYRPQHVEIDEELLSVPYEELNGRVQKELREEKILAKIDSLYWYKRDIIKLYLKLGTLEAVSKDTKIPKPSIYKTVKEAINELRSMVES